jgi:hypothetical protein
MNPTLDDIKILVGGLAERINAPNIFLPTFGHSIDGAHPHIEVSKEGNLYFVVIERGQENSRDQAKNMDDLLYKIFSYITNCMARYEYDIIRKARGDHRPEWFKMQEEIIGLLSLEWKERLQKEHQEILTLYPVRPRI